MKVEEESSNNQLEMIIGLYIRVRCHSYAKDTKEKNLKENLFESSLSELK